MEWMVVALLSLVGMYVFFIMPANYAAKRGSSWLGWFIISLFLPVLSWGLVLVWLSNKSVIEK